ncbi:MAG: hypothetical protein ACI85Q_002551 [Salibacteraceae bacterium]
MLFNYNQRFAFVFSPPIPLQNTSNKKRPDRDQFLIHPQKTILTDVAVRF